jgi:NADPH:quinone reductase-like Zn-dependent oxidoreductase
VAETKVPAEMLMKTIAFTKYGSTDFLELNEIETPTPNDDEVLIKVHAASINSWDYELLMGKPFANRAMFGLFKPKIKTLGADIAGQVVARGKNIRRFSPGDEVLGDLSGYGWGGFAEYVCVDENILALKSSRMTFEEAATLPQAGSLALHGLGDKGQVMSGQKVLINGAGGGVGTFAIQMAKSYGAIVTGVDSTEKLVTMTSIGADHVIDYIKEDFAKNGQQYDLIIDNVASRSIFAIKRALSTKGRYVIIGGTTIMQFVILGPLFAMTGKKMGLLIHNTKQVDINFINELLESGKVAAVIDRVYPLNEVPDALRYFGEGHAKGKVVITME